MGLKKIHQQTKLCSVVELVKTLYSSIYYLAYYMVVQKAIEKNGVKGPQHNFVICVLRSTTIQKKIYKK